MKLHCIVSRFLTCPDFSDSLISNLSWLYSISSYNATTLWSGRLKGHRASWAVQVSHFSLHLYLFSNTYNVGLRKTGHIYVCSYVVQYSSTVCADEFSCTVCGWVVWNAVWREAISRGGGDHGTRQADSQWRLTTVVTLRRGGREHCRTSKQAKLQISLSNKQSPLGSEPPGRLGKPLARNVPRLTLP